MNPWRATIWTASFLLVGAIAYAAAITTTLFVERSLQSTPAPRAAAQPEPAPRPQAREQRPLTAYKEVLDRNIFGAKPSEAKVARVARSAAPTPPPEPFEITLTGTFLAGEDSFAMVIGHEDREERVYRVGECLPQDGGEPGSKCSRDQARLTKIDLDRIVVLKGGKHITVEISKGPAGASPRLARSPTERSPAGRQRLRLNPTATPPGPRGATSDDQEADGEENPPAGAFPAERVGNTYQVNVPSAEVEKAFENFSEVVAQAAAVPIIENGEAKGFQLRKIRPGSIFERLGLKNYDLIRGVNGQSITTADQALRVFTLFRNEREIVLDVKRRDEELQFNYTVQ